MRLDLGILLQFHNRLLFPLVAISNPLSTHVASNIFHGSTTKIMGHQVRANLSLLGANPLVFTSHHFAFKKLCCVR